MTGRLDLSLACDSQQFVVSFVFPAPRPHEEAAAQALSGVQGIPRHKTLLEKLGKTRATIEKIRVLGNTVVQLLPAAEAALAICGKAWEKLEAQQECDVSIEILIDGLTDIFPYAEAVKKIAKIPQLHNTIVSLLSLVEDASRFILDYKGDGRAVQTLQAFTKSSAREQVEEILKNLQQLKEDFDRGVSVQTLQTAETSARYRLLDKLQPVGQAKYDSARACMHGTRVNIIQDIFDWANRLDEPHNSASERLFWLHGHAGLGKSAIATSICQLLDDNQLLAASFFCKRDDPQLRDPQRALTTIIHGLAVHHKAYADALVAQIEEDSSLCTSPIQMQFERLVRDALGSPTVVPPASCSVIVVDALDECGDEETRRPLLGYLLKISQLVSWLKIMVTSRPYKDIEELFRQSTPTNLSTRDLFQYDASNDIHAFIQQRLTNNKRSKLLPPDAADRLSHKADGLFIWAYTACQFIMNSYSPRERLNIVLEGDNSSPSGSTLDNLYTTAIKVSMDDGGEDNIRLVEQCLGAIIVCLTPLSVSALSDLLGERIDEDILQSVVDSLGSVLYIDHSKDDVVRIYHPSFADYMLSPSRSGDFCVSAIRHNTILAEACLITMMRDLKFNICGLETSYRRNREIQDLGERIRHRISRHLEYSCLYWTSHLVKAEKKTNILPEESLLSGLLAGPYVLYWIEILSLKQQLATVLPSLQHLKTWWDGYVNARAGSISLCADILLSDLGEYATSYFPNTIELIGKTAQDWSPWLHCISLNAKVLTVAVSPDGQHIVSGSSDGIVRIWDLSTGAPVGDPFIGHSAAVASVAFSPDGRRIVSGSFDHSVRVWNADTGALIGTPLVEQSYRVCCVAFSPDGRYITYGTSNQGVRIWDGESSAPNGNPLIRHSGQVLSVAFSPDGRRIASCGADGVQLWDMAERVPIGKLHSGHSFDATSMAYSPNGYLIASGAKDKTIRIWDTRENARKDTVLTGHANHVITVAFSPNGQRIVSGSKDATVRTWDMNNGAVSNISLVGHSAWVNCVTFSPSGQHIVSGSNDNTIRVWNADVSAATNSSFDGHSGEIHCVAFSPDGRRIASGSADKTIRVWDAETGTLTCKALVGHKKQVNCVAFSPDGLWVVSGSDDHTLRLWNSQTGTPVRKPLTGHSGAVSCVAVSPGGHRAVSGSWDKKIRVWDMDACASDGGPLAGHSSWILCLAFSTDGRRIVSGSADNTLRVWDADSGTPIGEPIVGHTDWVLYAAFTPDNRIISSSLNLTVRVWDEILGTMISSRDLPHKYLVRCVALSLDSRFAVSGSEQDRSLRVWNLNTGAPMGEPLVGHSSRIRTVAFSPDSQYIVSGSDDGTVRVWNTINDPSQISRGVSRVSKQCASDGWMYAGENDLLFWLPPECRRDQPEDSLFSITFNSVRDNVWLDYSKFVCGTSWTQIARSKS